MPLAEYAINHRRRDILGGRSAVEIVTGRQPRTAADLTLYSVTKLKDAEELTLSQERVAKYCVKLNESLERMHEVARDKEEENRRKRARKEASKGPGMRFNVGDYVMVSAVKNQANRQRHSKIMVR